MLESLKAPILQICKNAGVDGEEIVSHILKSNTKNYGYDALNDKYVDMIKSGIVDPTKVTRSALQNASSVASTLLTTESLVADTDEDKPSAPINPDMY